jgi:hypothetical protein
MKQVEIIDTTADNILEYGVCGYKNIKRAGFPEKVDWLKQRFKQSLKLKTLHSKKDGTQGMIEYIPGQYCWRPVEAAGYMFIHCLFVGFKKAYKGKGYASLLLDECERDARDAGMSGVAVVTRRGSFMVGKEIFLKRGYEVVDKAPSDFELLAKQFDSRAPKPVFKAHLGKKLDRYGKGLAIIRAAQCPYTVKNVNEIVDAAKQIHGLEAKVISLKNHKDAQASPCPFGTFCIAYDGRIIAEHPISRTRFTNIMSKLG